MTVSLPATPIDDHLLNIFRRVTIRIIWILRQTERMQHLVDQCYSTHPST